MNPDTSDHVLTLEIPLPIAEAILEALKNTPVTLPARTYGTIEQFAPLMARIIDNARNHKEITYRIGYTVSLSAEPD